MSGRRWWPVEDGFTLVELLVVLVLMGIVGSVAVSGVVSSMRTTRSTEARIAAFADLQMGAERISRDVRRACPLRAPLHPAALTAAVYAEGAPSEVTYAFDGTTGALRFQSVGAGPDIDRILVPELVPTAASPLFTYLDDDGNAALSAGDVRTVRIVLRRSLPEQPAVELETIVSLRNGGRSCD